jgi:cell wall-associated NlpC family hydrolase
MSPEQKQLIKVARSWLGTAWKHNQAKKGLGVDCVNFVCEVLKESGFEGEIDQLPTRYARVATYNEIEKYIDARAEVIYSVRPSAILLFNVSGYNNHLAFATSRNTMIHACITSQAVVEHNIDGVWRRQLTKMWKVF